MKCKCGSDASVGDKSCARHDITKGYCSIFNCFNIINGGNLCEHHLYKARLVENEGINFSKFRANCAKYKI